MTTSFIPRNEWCKNMLEYSRKIEQNYYSNIDEMKQDGKELLKLKASSIVIIVFNTVKGHRVEYRRS